MKIISKIRASAPAKIILFGEHSVVHGMPAIAIAVNRKTQVTITKNKDYKAGQIKILSKSYNQSDTNQYNKGFKKDYKKNKLFYPLWHLLEDVFSEQDIQPDHGLDIEIDSTIPQGAGMGSSAATAVSLTAAMLSYFNIKHDKEMISAIAYKAEQIIHGTPSGIDNSICTFGSGIVFEKGKITPIEVPKINIIIGDTCKPRETKKMVTKVRLRKEKWKFYSIIIEAMGSLVRESIPILRDGKGELLGELCDINHGLLDALGVSSPELNRLVEISRVNGAWGAKLTGGGGGGCMIALCSSDRVQNIIKGIEDAGGRAYEMEFEQNGVMVEKLD